MLCWCVFTAVVSCKRPLSFIHSNRLLFIPILQEVATVWSSFLTERYEDPQVAATPYYIPDEVMQHKTTRV